jgi:Ras-related protein Rab-1A
MPNLISTVGIDFRIKTFELAGKTVKLYLWDTAGQERFRVMGATYYRGSHGVLFVYDCSSKLSFDNIVNWLGSVNNYIMNPSNYTLVATKCDLENRVITRKDGEDLAMKHNMAYYEVSSKTGDGIDDMFTTITSDVLTRILDIKEFPTNEDFIDFNAKKKESECCEN